MSKAESNIDNLIAFPSRDIPECPVTYEPKDILKYCDHPRITIRELERQVVCVDCGAVLDPFDYLRGQAIAMRRGWELYRSAVARTREIQADIERLEREKRNLKAQIKRTKGKVEPLALDMRKPFRDGV